MFVRQFLDTKIVLITILFINLKSHLILVIRLIIINNNNNLLGFVLDPK